VDYSDINEARTNPEFLEFLYKQEQKAKEEKNIAELYQVLDTLLVLDLDEERIHTVYQEILKIAFDQIEDRLANGKLLSLEGDDIYFVRSFYEHGIEKWSRDDFKGASELFFILSQIIEDEKLSKAVVVHLLNSAQDVDIDSFYANDVNVDDLEAESEPYGYFITRFNFDLDQYLDKNQELIEKQYESYKHLLN
jgi:hypothetical protein